MKKSTFIAIPSSYIVITTLVYTILVATTFFEIDDNALIRGENFDDDDDFVYSTTGCRKTL